MKPLDVRDMGRISDRCGMSSSPCRLIPFRRCQMRKADDPDNRDLPNESGEGVQHEASVVCWASPSRHSAEGRKLGRVVYHGKKGDLEEDTMGTVSQSRRGAWGSIAGVDDFVIFLGGPAKLVRLIIR